MSRFFLIWLCDKAFESFSFFFYGNFLIEMKVIAAYLLAVLGGNPAPSAADLKDILGSG